MQFMRPRAQPRLPIHIRYHRRPYRDVCHIPFGLLEQELLPPRGRQRNLENSLIHQTPFVALVVPCHCRDDNVSRRFLYRCDTRQPPIRRHVQKYWRE